MADVKVNFVHPTDERAMEVVIDDAITAREALAELLANDFLPPSPMGYQLEVNGRPLRDDETLAAANVAQNSKIRVLPAIGAGVEKVRS
jgi:hypothetical protein